MPNERKTSTSPASQSKTVARKRGWSMEIKAQEPRVALTLSVPVSMKADIEVLTTHFGQGMNEIAVQLLKHALSTNSDLAKLRTDIPAPGKEGSQPPSPGATEKSVPSTIA